MLILKRRKVTFKVPLLLFLAYRKGTLIYIEHAYLGYIKKYYICCVLMLKNLTSYKTRRLLHLKRARSCLWQRGILHLVRTRLDFMKDYYSTIMSFYHIRSREQAKYEAVIHCSVLV